MIGLSNPSPPSPPELRVLTDLIALLSDPEASSKRVADLAAAGEEARKAIGQAAADREEVARLRAATERDLAEARAAHDAKLRDDRATFAEEVARRAAELDARERHVDELTAAAEAAKAAAERLRADLDRRLKIILDPAGASA